MAWLVGYVDAHKVVAQKNAFPVLGNAQNEGVSEVRTESLGHGGLKHSFSLVERDLNLLKILKPTSLPEKKKPTKKKAAIVTIKEEDEEGEYVGKNWANGEVLHLIALQGEMKLEFAKNAKQQGTFQLIKALENCKNFFRSDFYYVFIIENWLY